MLLYVSQGCAVKIRHADQALKPLVFEAQPVGLVLPFSLFHERLGETFAALAAAQLHAIQVALPIIRPCVVTAGDKAGDFAAQQRNLPAAIEPVIDPCEVGATLEHGERLAVLPPCLQRRGQAEQRFGQCVIVGAGAHLGGFQRSVPGTDIAASVWSSGFCSVGIAARQTGEQHQRRQHGWRGSGHENVLRG